MAVHSKRTRLAALGATAILASSLMALGGTALASSRAVHPSAVPTVDIVGKGVVNCATVTGEVGYSPAISSAGKLNAHERVSIWFVGTNCKNSHAKPIPKTVIGSMSYLDNFGTTCPQISSAAGAPFGAGTLNLAYNYPPVPAIMIDPSVAALATVQSSIAFGPALWQIAGAVTDGSYSVSPGFIAQIKPIPFGGQNCAKGITSEYITRGTLSKV